MSDSDITCSMIIFLNFEESNECCDNSDTPAGNENIPEAVLPTLEPPLLASAEQGGEVSDCANIQNKTLSIKPGLRISGKFNDGGSFVGRVHSRGGKATGANKHVMNVSIDE